MADICIDLFSELYRMLATAVANMSSNTVTNMNPSSIGQNLNPNQMVINDGDS